jgi:hypothetical protein
MGQAFGEDSTESFSAHVVLVSISDGGGWVSLEFPRQHHLHALLQWKAMLMCATFSQVIPLVQHWPFMKPWWKFLVLSGWGWYQM